MQLSAKEERVIALQKAIDAFKGIDDSTYWVLRSMMVEEYSIAKEEFRYALGSISKDYILFVLRLNDISDAHQQMVSRMNPIQMEHFIRSIATNPGLRGSIMDAIVGETKELMSQLFWQEPF